MRYIPIFLLALLGACSQNGQPISAKDFMTNVVSKLQAADATVCPVIPTVEQTANAVGAATGVTVNGDKTVASVEAVTGILCAAFAPTPTATPIPPATVTPAASVVPMATPAANVSPN